MLILREQNARPALNPYVFGSKASIEFLTMAINRNNARPR
jgi:hypothetical protein